MSETPPNNQDIFKKTDAALKALDEQRSEALKKLRALQAMKKKALEEERERLEEEYGSDHPRVRKFAAKLAFNEGIQKDLENLIMKADMEAWKHDYAIAADDDTALSQEADEGTSPETSDIWTVQGEITDEKGIGIGGLIVSLYDKDLLFDDVLGTITTDWRGRFRIMYRAEAFRDLFEQQPDLYLKVIDDQGSERYSSKEAVRLEGGRVETFNVTVARKPDDEEE
jgi:hypothetical protein